MKRTADGSVSVSPFYQRLFVAALLWGWLAGQVMLLRLYLDSYINHGTWTFQVTMWMYPVVFFALSLWAVAGRYAIWRARLFFAMLLTAAGLSVYNGLMAVEQYFYNNYTRSHPIMGGSYWSVYGNEWVAMILGIVLFAGALLYVRKRG